MAFDTQQIVIGVAIVFAAYMLYKYYYEDKSSAKSSGTTSGAVFKKTAGCNGGLQNLVAEHQLNAQLDAGVTQADYDNNVASTQGVRAGATLYHSNTMALDRDLDKKYGVSDSNEELKKYQRYYGCVEDTYAPATCFDGGSMMFNELKQVVSRSQ